MGNVPCGVFLNLARLPPIRSLARVSSTTTPDVAPLMAAFKERSARFIACPLVVALAFCIWRFWPEWAGNPDLSHGFFTPLIFIVLLKQSRRQGPHRWLATGQSTALVLMSSGLAVGLAGLMGLLAVSLGWSHALVVFLLGATLSTALLSGLACFASVRRQVIPFNWVSVTAVGLWILSVPLPSGTYTRLMLELQGAVSSGVITLLQLLGIPARQHGNIIELAHTTVGIAEACSGIRSLLSCIYAGFFFAAWQVRSPAGRALLIVLAPALAFGMNFLRSVLLTLMADRGIEIMGFWHDVTGFAILGLTALILALLALRLGRNQTTGPAAATPVSPEPGRPDWALRFHLGGSSLLVLLTGVYVFYGRSTPGEPAIDPGRLLPEAVAGWDVRTTPGLYEFSGILKTEHLVERTYTKIGSSPKLEFSLYIAHWAQGQAPVSLVASHTPDACWPGGGWKPQGNTTPQVELLSLNHRLPWGEYRIFQDETSRPQYVWFWHVYNGHVINYRDPYSIPALLEIALRYGFRREGPQYFIRVTSAQPWDRLATEPLVDEIVQRLIPVGFVP